MRAAAEALARRGWTLRSGMSPGADRAFYEGALRGAGEVELFLPHAGFGASARRRREEDGRVRELQRPTTAAYQLAERFCPGWASLDDRARALIARDGHQVLGAGLREPAELVVCWTPDADLEGSSARSGGTGQALRVAHANAIPVLNLRLGEHAEWLSELAGLQ